MTAVLLILTAGAAGFGLAAGRWYFSRDARILRARRRDARRHQRAQDRKEREIREKLRLAGLGYKVGQIEVPNAPPIPVRSRIPDPPPRA